MDSERLLMDTERLDEFNALGQSLYGNMWEAIRRRNTARISGHVTEDSSELTPSQLQLMIDAMKVVKANKKESE